MFADIAPVVPVTIVWFVVGLGVVPYLNPLEVIVAPLSDVTFASNVALLPVILVEFKLEILATSAM